jgi:integrase
MSNTGKKLFPHCEGATSMARKVRNAELDSRSAREKLRARGKPYFRTIEKGLHLGYRKLKGKGRALTGGKWVLRHYVGEQTYEVETIATADDLTDADGVAILDYWQAQTLARERMASRARKAAGKGPCTVAVAIERYLQALEAKGKDPTDTRFRAEAMIIPSLGAIEIADLTADRIRKWVTQLASTPPRLRTAKGEPQRYRAVTRGDEALRRRRSTANRIIAILKAALTHSYREGFLSTDAAWRRVKLFENVTSARIRILSIAEAQRLLNACDVDFRELVHAALLTGCRYGELCRLTTADFNADAGTVAILRSKSGKARHVVLTEEGTALFEQLCAGRVGDELLLRKANGKQWGKSHQISLMVDACARASIKPPINFHGLRHTWASLAVMNGMPLMVVAENLGHADTRMVQKHYGHMSRSYVADAIRAAAPRFGAVKQTNIREMRSR